MVKVDGRDGILSLKNGHDILHAKLLKPGVRFDSAAGIVARQHDPPRGGTLQCRGQLEQAGVDVRLLGVYVDGRSAEVAVLQVLGQRVLVDQGATRHVNKPGARREETKGAGGDEGLAVG